MLQDPVHVSLGCMVNNSAEDLTLLKSGMSTSESIVLTVFHLKVKIGFLT
jgi:hypothetical protein